MCEGKVMQGVLTKALALAAFRAADAEKAWTDCDHAATDVCEHRIASDRADGVLDEARWALVASIDVGHVTEIFPNVDGEDETVELNAYVAADVTIDGTVYALGCMLGVPDAMMGSAIASGARDSAPFLSAWWNQSEDYASIPAFVEASDVLEAILEKCGRLWREAKEMRAEGASVLISARRRQCEQPVGC